MSSTIATELIEAVRAHADAVLAAAADEYGDEQTPLLVDAFDAETGAAIPYDGRDVVGGRYLSNVAFQQTFLRTLVALTALTGEERYREAAADIVRFAFERVSDETGLLYWGGHAAYDLAADDTVVGKDNHELKFEYPFYEFLWTVDPEATERFVEAFWNAHVRDWSRLDFNRHGPWDAPMGDCWDREYEGGNVFFWGDGLTFVNTGSDLYYAAGLLSAFTGEDAPLEWAERLAGRYVETRGETGISGYQFSQHASYCNGPEIRGDRAQYQFDPYVPGDHWICEGTLFRPRPIVQRQQLVLGERLGDRGRQFTEWAVEELRAWREAAYRPERNDFEPILTDGYSLEGFVIRREGYFGPKGRIVGPIEAGPEFLWTYARAARQTGDEVCWRTARDIATGLGLGDVGGPGGDPAPDLALEPEALDYQVLYALLELSRATDDAAYLDAATDLAGRLLDHRREGDVLVDAEGRVLLNDPAPLAMLRVAAAERGADADLPEPVGDRSSPVGGF